MTEVPSIPATLLQMPPFPAKPEPPRTNMQMHFYRKELEQTLCEAMYRASEVVRFATLGQQSVEVSRQCQ